MHPRLLKFAQDVSASYWFIPMCLVALSIAIAAASVWLDRNVASSLNLLWIDSLGVDDARTILNLISGSVIGIAGVSFSITIVAVSFATSNFGPRLISNFMTDRGNQFTLGVFIGVFVFCLMILSSLHSSTSYPDAKNIEQFVPRIGVAVSLVLAVLSMGVLIYFIHHVAESINIENILARIGRNLEHKVVQLFPETGNLDEHPLEKPFTELTTERHHKQVCAEESGYIQTLNLDTMLELAREQNLLIDAHIRPGDYVSRQTVLMSVWYTDLEEPQLQLKNLRDCFATGDQRTEHQNVLFLVEQLTEVIGRALSSGINDPYTAITCLNWLRNALIIYLQSIGDSEVNELTEYHRVRLKHVSLEQLLEVVFDACEQHVAGDEKVTLHTLAVLVECASHAPDEQTRELIVARFNTLYERALECLDRQAIVSIDQRHREAQAILTRAISENDARQHYRWFAGSA